MATTISARPGPLKVARRRAGLSANRYSLYTSTPHSLRRLEMYWALVSTISPQRSWCPLTGLLPATYHLQALRFLPSPCFLCEAAPFSNATPHREVFQEASQNFSAHGFVGTKFVRHLSNDVFVSFRLYIHSFGTFQDLWWPGYGVWVAVSLSTTPGRPAVSHHPLAMSGTLEATRCSWAKHKVFGQRPSQYIDFLRRVSRG